MRVAMDETERRHKIQDDYNKANGITPKTIVKPISNTLEITTKVSVEYDNIPDQIEKLKGLMRVASGALDFETAIKMRDRIAELKELQAKIKRGMKNG